MIVKLVQALQETIDIEFRHGYRQGRPLEVVVIRSCCLVAAAALLMVRCWCRVFLVTAHTLLLPSH